MDGAANPDIDDVLNQASPRANTIDTLVERCANGVWSVVEGPMGIGKSHVLATTSARLRADGWICTEIRANPAAATIPFGAFAAIVAAGDDLDRVRVFEQTVDRLVSTGGGRPHVVTIDDAPLLDEQSIAVLHRIATETDIAVIATVRSSDRSSPLLQSLWHTADVARTQLGPLTAGEAVDLATQITGLSPDDEKIEDLVRRAAGNPLFLTELGRAHVDGHGRITVRLREAVERRIGRLSDASKRQLTLVAVADPLDTDLGVADASALAELERAGLIVTAEEGDYIVARPAHPLYGEVVRDGLTPLTRRTFARELTQAMAERPALKQGDALRLAGWLRACGDEPAADLAVPAALEAISLLDVDLATELVEIATSIEPDYAALLAAGEVARVTGDFDRALEWFDRAFELAESDEEIRQVSMAIAQIHGFCKSNPAGAVAVLEQAASRLTSTAQRLEVETERALFGSMLGLYEDVLVSAREVLEHPESDEMGRWTALTNITWAEAQLMDFRELDRHLVLAEQMLPSVPPDREVDLVGAVRINMLNGLGEFDRAVRYALDFVSERLPSGLVSFSVAQTHIIRGDLDRARFQMDEGVSKLANFDPFNSLPFVLGASGLLAAMKGDAELARNEVQRAIDRTGGTGMWERIWLGRAHAWIAASIGDFDEAVERLLETAHDAMSTSHLGWALFAIHDAIAWGGAGLMENVAAKLLSRIWDAPIFGLMAEGLLGVARGDEEAAGSAMSGLIDYGATQLAAVTALGAAEIMTNEVDAARMASIGRFLGESTIPVPDAIKALGPSDRQLAVAIEAAKGRASRDIADELFLSVRTVDNHLRAVYRQLDVKSRSDLHTVLSGQVAHA